MTYCDLERINAGSSRKNEPNFRPAGGGSHAIAWRPQGATPRAGFPPEEQEELVNRLYDPFPLHSRPPHLLNLLNLLVAGLIAVCSPFLCLNSAFSRHFSTFYGPSVQAMDIRLNALPILPSALGSFLAAGTPRFSDLNEGDNAPRPMLFRHQLKKRCGSSHVETY